MQKAGGCRVITKETEGIMAKKKAKKAAKKVKKAVKKAAKKTAKKVKKAVKKAVKKVVKKAAKKKAVKKAAAKKKAVKKVAKKAAKKVKKAAKKAVKRTPSAAFMKAMRPSAALARIVGPDPLPRTEITKKLWAYIKRNDLQDKVNKRMINADSNLREIFEGRSQVSMFDMTKLVNKHLS